MASNDDPRASPNLVARAHAYARNVSGAAVVDYDAMEPAQRRQYIESVLERAFIIGFAAGVETATDPRRRR